jgi:hypothetical protein
VGDLRKIMRGRHLRTQSATINTLIAEEAERLRALAVLNETAASADPDDFDDRLL